MNGMNDLIEQNRFFAINICGDLWSVHVQASHIGQGF
jgi:hypothetical protein